MSLMGALNIGRSALAINQAALQVTGNNIANAGNADYTRQVANTSPSADQQLGQGITVGTGVDLTSIQRQIDQALQGRLQSSISDDSSASTTSQWLSQVESTFNALGSNDISSQMSTFFNSWSTLANNPQDASQRSVVLQEGQNLASSIQTVRSDLASIQTNLGASIQSVVTNANSLADQIASLNQQIASSGGSANNSLLDQRDAALKQLSALTDVRTADGGNGMVNVFIGSEPLVTGGVSRGLTTTQSTVGTDTITTVAFKNPAGGAVVSSGQLGALVQLQTGQLKTTIDQLDSLAGNLINELNKTYSSGQGAVDDHLVGFSSVTATNAVSDTSVPLNDPASGLAFKPVNGSFTIAVYDTASQQYVSNLVPVDLDGVGGDDTTLSSLAATINAKVPGVSATITGGKLTISATDPGTQVVFSNDTSGTLASLGINTFFTGSNAQDIGVNQVVASNTSLLAVTSTLQPGGNKAATDIAGLQNQSISGLNGATLVSSYQNMINGTATATQTAQNNATAASTVRQALETQRENLSGVSMDEEAVNLIKQQRAFQGAAKLVSAIDDMMKTILNMVG